MVPEAGPGRNHVAQDDVLLQAHQQVALAGEGCLGEHLGRLLEGCSRDKRIGGQRGLGDPQEQRQAGCRLATLLAHPLILAAETVLVHDGAGQEPGVTRIRDLHLTHHLRQDGLDVLVIDGHRLTAVDVLNFTQQVLLHRVLAVDSQNILGIQGAIDQRLAGNDLVALVNPKVLTLGDSVLVLGNDLTFLV